MMTIAQLQALIRSLLDKIAPSAPIATLTASVFGGTDKADTLTGNGNANALVGLGGDDTLSGAGGIDFLHGGNGNDRISGGDGNDIAYGGNGNDTVYGDRGDDLLFGGNGNDYVHGGAGADRIYGNAGDDSLYGSGGNDLIVDGDGNDAMRGDAGNDRIMSYFGSDRLDGGLGNDHLTSRSDAGEPEIAQDPELPLKTEAIADSDDTLTGGAGADKFYFRLDLSTTEEIARCHVDDRGVIDWEGVAGENNAAHDHWVESLGDDTILDFSRDEGDQIIIKGHTVDFEIEEIDEDGDGSADYAVIHLFSNQGGAGAHNGDSLGTITVRGDLVTADDICLDAGVHYGKYVTLDQLIMA